MANMEYMFGGSGAFNSDISNWDVSKVTSMRYMFKDATSFNADISNWDVSRVRNMYRMFSDAESFNCDISNWDVSRVTYMQHMFCRATSFNQALCEAPWVQSTAVKDGMFFGSPGSISTALCTASRAVFSPQSKDCLLYTSPSPRD